MKDEKPTLTLVRQLGMSDREATIYEVLLRSGVLTSGEISALTGFPLDDVERTLASLAKKNVVLKVPGIIDRYVAMPPFMLLGETLSTCREEILKAYKQFSDVIKRIEGEITKLAKDFRENSKKILEDGVKTVSERIPELMKDLEEILSENLEKISKDLEEVENKITNVIERAIKGISSVVKEARSSAERSISNGERALVGVLERTLEEVNSTIEEKSAEHASAGQEVLDGFHVEVERITGDVSKQLEALKSNLIERVSGIRSDFSETFKSMLERFEQISAEFTEVLEGLMTGIERDVPGSLGKVLELHRDVLAKTKENISTTLSEVLSRVQSGIASMKRDITTFLTETTMTEEQQLGDLEKMIDNLLKELRETLDNAFNTISSTVAGATKHAKTMIEQNARSLVVKVAQVARSFINAYYTHAVRFRDSVLSAISDEFDALKVEFDGLRRNLTEKITDILETYKSGSNTVIREIEGWASTTFSDISANMEKFRSDIIKIIKQTRDAVNKRISSVAIDKDVFGDLNQGLARISDLAKRALTGIISNLETHINRLTDVLHSYISSQISSLRARIEAAMHEVEGASDPVKFMSETLAEIEEIIRTMDEGLKQKVSFELSRMRQSVDRLSLTLESDVDTWQRDLEQLVEDIMGQINSMLNFSVDVVTRTMETAERRISSSMEGLQKLVSRLIEHTKKQITSIVSSEIRGIERETEAFINGLKDTFSKFIESISMLGGRIGEKIKSELEFLKRMEEMGKKLDDAIMEVFSEYQSSMVKVFDESEKAIELALDSLRELDEEIISVRKSFEKSFKSFIDDVKRRIDGAVKALEGCFDDVSKSIEDAIQEVMKIVSQNTDSLERRVDGLFTSARKEIIDRAKERISKCHDRIIKVGRLYAEELKTESSAMNSLLSDMQNSLDVLISTGTKNIHTTMTSIEEKVRKMMSEHTVKVKSALDDVKKKLNESINNLVASSKDLLSNMSKEIGSTLDNVKKKHEELGTSIGAETTSTLSKVSPRVSSLLEEFRRKVEGDLMSVANEISLKAKALSLELDGAASQIIEGVSRGLKLARVDEHINALEDEMRDAENLIKRLLEVSVSIGPYLASKTWYCIGVNAIIARIRDIISRAEEKLAVMAPRFSMLADLVDPLLEAGQRCRIFVIAEVSDDDDLKVAGELSRSGNIRVKRAATGSYYCVLRDDKEVLVAPMEDEDREVMAFTSQLDGYVSLIKEIFNFFMRKSTRVMQKK